MTQLFCYWINQCFKTNQFDEWFTDSLKNSYLFRTRIIEYYWMNQLTRSQKRVSCFIPEWISVLEQISLSDSVTRSKIVTCFVPEWISLLWESLNHDKFIHSEIESVVLFQNESVIGSMNNTTTCSEIQSRVLFLNESISERISWIWINLYIKKKENGWTIHRLVY